MGRNKARRKAPVSRAQAQTQWAIITYTAGSAQGSGYFLDKFVPGEREDAEAEAAAAREEGKIGLYSHTFVTPLTHGFMRFADQRIAPMDVWLYRRKLAERNEYMVKVTKALETPIAPPESEEWEAILIAQGWMAPETTGRGKAMIKKVARAAKEIPLPP